MPKRGLNPHYDDREVKGNGTSVWLGCGCQVWPNAPAINHTPLPSDSPIVMAKNHSYKSRVVLFRQGESPRDIYWICSGLVKLSYVDGRGRELIIGLRGSGAFLGLPTAILRRPHATSAETLTPCMIQIEPAEELIRRLSTSPALAAYVHEFNAREIAANIEKLIDIATKAVRHNLLKLLSQIIVESEGRQAEKRRLVQIPMKQWELAHLLGVTPEHLNRVLRSMEHQGVVSRTGNSLFVTDVHRLMSHSSSGDPEAAKS